jgi:outer membrane protein TolC
MSKTIEKILFIILLLPLAGCQSFNGQLVRKTHAENYNNDLAGKTNKILAEKDSFGLNDCIQIAMENNLRTKAAKIQQQIAKLERKIAFASFLPAVNLDYEYTRWDRQPKIKFGATTAALHDQAIKEITWQIQMSVFDPATWYLYSMHKRGEEIAELVTKYTEQMTVLEVTVNYYLCLALQQAQSALQSQLNAANELEKEISVFWQEGTVTQWQYEQAQVSVLARKTELTRIQSVLKQTTADLLVSMGISPSAEITLKVEQPLKEPNEPLEDLVYRALIENPQLHIADRQVAIEEEKVKVAIAAFLPRLTVFANRTNTSDSFQLFQDFWTYGLSGTLAVFNGFANINEYKAAKERKKEAFIEREQQTLTLMLEVFKAYLNLQSAKDLTLLARKSSDAASTHFDEVNEKWKEGTISSSEMLAVLAEKDNAQAELMVSDFILQVSIATLQNVMGITDTPKVLSKKD